MYLLSQRFEDEQGSVLLVALLILVLLTIIGISATTDTEIETLIAGNERFHKIALYNADSGIFPTAKLISTTIDSQTEPASNQYMSYLGANDTFFTEVMGYDVHDDEDDIQFIQFIPPDSYEVNVDVDRIGRRSIVGGVVEFGAGAEGVGAGSTGGVAVFFKIDSKGDGPSNSVSNVTADYRKVVGVPGGL